MLHPNLTPPPPLTDAEKEVALAQIAISMEMHNPPRTLTQEAADIAAHIDANMPNSIWYSVPAINISSQFNTLINTFGAATTHEKWFVRINFNWEVDFVPNSERQTVAIAASAQTFAQAINEALAELDAAFVIIKQEAAAHE